MSPKPVKATSAPDPSPAAPAHPITLGVVTAEYVVLRKYEGNGGLRVPGDKIVLPIERGTALVRARFIAPLS